MAKAPSYLSTFLTASRFFWAIRLRNSLRLHKKINYANLWGHFTSGWGSGSEIVYAVHYVILNFQTRNDDIKKGNFSILKQLFFVFRNNFKLEFKSLFRFIM